MENKEMFSDFQYEIKSLSDCLEEEFIYRPANTNNRSFAINATVGVKFSQKTILLKSFLDLHHIPYSVDELEMTCLGLGLVFTKDNSNGMDLC